jgi:putative glutamine amidotransferase
LLLQDAFNLHKPILGICQGAQALNVWCNGTLIQDIDTVLKTQVNHRPGRGVVEAHPVKVEPATRLAKLVKPGAEPPQVNSSHHQAVGRVGDNLIVSAISPGDDVIEAIELDSADHFVLAVQWHPERTYTDSPLSRAIFAAFVKAAEAWQPRRVEESVVRV